MPYFTSPTLPKIQAFKKIYGIEMGTDTVQQFFEKLMKQTKDLEIADDQVMALFVGGLVPAIQKYVLTKEPRDLIEALNLAKQQELIGTPAEQIDMALLRKLLAQHKTEPKPVAQVSTTPIVCVWCGQKGHYATSCPDMRIFHQNRDPIPSNYYHNHRQNYPQRREQYRHYDPPSYRPNHRHRRNYPNQHHHHRTHPTNNRFHQQQDPNQSWPQEPTDFSDPTPQKIKDKLTTTNNRKFLL